MAEIDSRISWPGWETKEVLGWGSYAAVYEIQRVIFGHTEKAAMKVISLPKHDTELEEMRSEGLDDRGIQRVLQEKLEKIVSEYILMRKLNGCSNVVNCDDVRYQRKESGVGWEIFIKMEKLTPLAKALELRPRDDDVYRVGIDLCKALLLCKRHSILHRDIKPANTFLSDNGDFKLGDFGIAKTVESTVGGTKIGTFEYMAPEVYNNRPYGPRADIYSLGLVLYWLLNERRTPFLRLPPEVPTTTEKEEAKMRRFRGEPIPAPCHGSDTLKRIVLRACAFDPEDRYQSPEELLRDLETRSFALRSNSAQKGRRNFKSNQGSGGTTTDDGTMGVFYGRGRDGQNGRGQGSGTNGQRQQNRDQNNGYNGQQGYQGQGGGTNGQRQQNRDQNNGYNGQQGYQGQNNGYNGQQQGYQGQSGGYNGQQQGYQGQNNGYNGQQGYQSQNSEYNGQQGYQGQNSDYNGQQGYQGQNSDYNGQQGYQGQSSGYNSQQQGYQGQNNGYNGQQQGYQGQNGGYNDQRQQNRDQNGGYNDQRQQNRGQNGGYNDQRQQNRGQNSGYNSQQQGYQGQNSGYNSQQQGYQGQNSGYNNQQQGYQGQNSGYNGQQQGYQGQNGGYNSQQWENRGRSGQNPYLPEEEFENYDFNPYVPDLNQQDSGKERKREGGILAWTKFRNAQKRQKRMDDFADPEQLERESWGDFDGMDVSDY